MHRDVMVEKGGAHIIVRVEDQEVSEISDIVAMRLAYEQVYQDAHNDEVVKRQCSFIVPHVTIGLDGKVLRQSHWLPRSKEQS